MSYAIRMGIPEMDELWNTLKTKHRDGTISKKDEDLYNKWGNALKKLSSNPMYPSLKSHEITKFSDRCGSCGYSEEICERQIDWPHGGIDHRIVSKRVFVKKLYPLYP